MAENKETKLLEEIRQRREDCREAWATLHESIQEDLAFENGEQWEEDSLTEREGRPSLVINKVSALCKQVIGSVRQNKPGVKIRPVDSESDPAVAEVFSGLIRNIENISDAETCYDTALDGSVRGGIGFWRVITEYSADDTFDQDIKLKRITNPFSVLLDPMAQEITWEDGRYAFVTSDFPREEFKKQYGEDKLTNFDREIKNNSEDSSLAAWIGTNTINVAEYFYKKEVKKTLCMLTDGTTFVKEDTDKELVEQVKPLVVNERTVNKAEVWWCLTNGVDILEKPKRWAGDFIPIIPCCGDEVWLGKERTFRSLIKWAKDPQRLYNWARSTACETLAMAPKQPFIGTAEAIEGHEDQWYQHHRKPMPILLYNKSEEPPQRQMSSIPDNGALNEAMNASEDIKATTGIYDASLGARSNETSGVAIVARQREGDNSTFVFVDNQNKAIAYTAKVLVNLIPKIYDTERVIRLLGPDGQEGWVQVNKETPMGVINDITKGKYDVVMESGPGLMTKRMEAANALIQVLQTAPNLAPVIVPRLIKNLDIPDALEIAEEIQQMMNPPQQGPSESEMADAYKKKLDIEKSELEKTKKELDIEGKFIQNAQNQFDLGQDLTEVVNPDVETINRELAGEI